MTKRFRFKFLAFFLIFFFFFFFSFLDLFAFIPSDERRLFRDIGILSFGGDEAGSSFSFARIVGTEVEFVLSSARASEEVGSDLLGNFLSSGGGKGGNRGGDLSGGYYDEDYTIYFSSEGGLSFSLTLLKSYDIIFDFRGWNRLIDGIVFSFFKGKLFEKDLSLVFGDISEVLVLLVEIEAEMGEAVIGTVPINYGGKNRFVWDSGEVYIEYTFSPRRNMFKQFLGYKGRLFIRERVQGEEYKKYISRVKRKLRKLVSLKD